VVVATARIDEVPDAGEVPRPAPAAPDPVDVDAHARTQRDASGRAAAGALPEAARAVAEGERVVRRRAGGCAGGAGRDAPEVGETGADGGAAQQQRRDALGGGTEPRDASWIRHPRRLSRDDELLGQVDRLASRGVGGDEAQLGRGRVRVEARAKVGEVAVEDQPLVDGVRLEQPARRDEVQ
jgi:hypothetical protein